MEHEDARGAADIVGMMDAVYKITNHGEGLYNIKNVKPRLVTAAEAIDIDYRVEDVLTETGHWRMVVESIIREEMEVSARDKMAAAILNALQNGPLNQSAITAEVGTGTAAALHDLVEGGYIQTWKDARKVMYGMPGDAPSFGGAA
jgi:hypothetical protein